MSADAYEGKGAIVLADELLDRIEHRLSPMFLTDPILTISFSTVKVKRLYGRPSRSEHVKPPAGYMPGPGTLIAGISVGVSEPGRKASYRRHSVSAGLYINQRGPPEWNVSVDGLPKTREFVTSSREEMVRGVIELVIETISILPSPRKPPPPVYPDDYDWSAYHGRRREEEARKVRRKLFARITGVKR